VEKEQKIRAPDFDRIAMVKGAFLYRDAIDKCAVAAIEIENPELITFSLDQTMSPGYRGMIDGKLIGGEASDGEFCCRQRDNFSIQRSGNGYKSGVHFTVVSARLFWRHDSTISL
jgi:hypothetical protein